MKKLSIPKVDTFPLIYIVLLNALRLTSDAVKGTLNLKTCVAIRYGSACRWKTTEAPKNAVEACKLEIELPNRTYAMFCDTLADTEHWFMSLDIARAGVGTLVASLGPRDRKETFSKAAQLPVDAVAKSPTAFVDSDDNGAISMKPPPPHSTPVIIAVVSTSPAKVSSVTTETTSSKSLTPSLSASQLTWATTPDKAEEGGDGFHQISLWASVKQRRLLNYIH